MPAAIGYRDVGMCKFIMDSDGADGTYWRCVNHFVRTTSARSMCNKGEAEAVTNRFALAKAAAIISEAVSE